MSSPAVDRAFVIRTAVVLGAVLAALVVCMLAWKARLAFLVIYLSVIVAAGCARPIVWLQRIAQRRRVALPRWLAALIVYIIALAVIAAVIGLATAPLISQVDQLRTGIPELFDRFQDELRRYGLLARRVTIQEAMQSIPRSDAVGSMKGILTAGSTLAHGMAGVVSVLILSFYLAIRATDTSTWLLGWIPPQRRPIVRTLGEEAVARIGHWVAGTAVVGGIMGVLVLASLSLLGVPFAYVVALLAVCGEAIPLVGPLLAGSVAVAVALSASPKVAAIVGVLFLLFHELEANILLPKVMEGRVGISAVAVICGLLVGWELGGVTGAVLAIPTVTWMAVVAEHFRGGETSQPSSAPVPAAHAPLRTRRPLERVAAAMGRGNDIEIE